MPRRRAVLAVTLGAGAIAATVALAARGGSSGDPAAATAATGSTATATATISRRDLVEIDTEDGTLGYADARTVTNRLAGTVTWLSPPGRVVRPDRTLYRVDESPVVLMNGTIPAYRSLGPRSSEGVDVRQLERTLRAAGHDPDRRMTVDKAWDAGTTAAVVRWQDAHGLPETGAIELGRIVFMPGTRRVATTAAAPPGAGPPPGAGAPAGASAQAVGAPQQATMTTTSTRREVSVALDTTKSTLARPTARVTIELPSGPKVGGRIRSVGKVATAVPTAQGAPPTADATATIAVKIGLFSRTAALDRAPVTVRFEKSRRRDVLAIPVTALLVAPGGRYAVQLVQAGGSRRVIDVQAGLYTSGYVEIAGRGLRPGQRVTNAAVR